MSGLVDAGRDRSTRHRGPDLAGVAAELAEGVRGLPGVVAVFPVWSGVAPWIGQPEVEIVERGGEVDAAVSIGVALNRSGRLTGAEVTALLRTALEAHGLAVGRIRVQVALVA